ncbi:MAG: tetratricopeptide repeat protein [Acidobacteriota bacterium]|nr:tetratricopeptide repeat protein [Acidobacteriota bacterium]
MPILSAENCFKKGLVALAAGRPSEASTLFEAAMAIERERGVGRPQMRYLSYYGLSLASVRHAGHDAVRACEEAVRREPFNPDLFLNLGKVYLRAGKHTRALEAFERGLRLDRRHRGLRAALAKADRRADPPIKGFGRSHPVNRLLGRIRYSITRTEKVPEKRTV